MTALRLDDLSLGKGLISHPLYELHGVAQKFIVSFAVEMSKPTVLKVSTFVDSKVIPGLEDYAVVNIGANAHDVDLVLSIFVIGLKLHYKGYFVY